MPRALIVGISGQDGAYLARLLGARGVTVAGTTRTAGVPAAISALGVAESVSLHHFEPAMADADTIARLLDATAPDAIYHLAGAQPAHGHAGTVTDIQPWTSALLRHAPRTRLFAAVSAAAFGPGAEPASETTPLNPVDAFGAANALVAQHVFAARDAGVYASAGLLFAHESRFGPPASLLQRIVRAAFAASRGAPVRLDVASLDAQIDCGWAPEYVDAMLRTLLAAAPADYVIATGHWLSVRDAVTAAFGWFKQDWAPHVSESVVAATVPIARRGDPAQARAQLGWRATTYGADLVQTICEGVAAEAQS